MPDYSWTHTRKLALELFIRAGGNACEAARLASIEGIKVSYGLLNTLKNRPEHRPFRDEYERRTGEMLSDLGITTEYVLGGIKDEAEDCKHDPTRLRAKELLGKYKRLFTDKQEIELKGGIGIDLAHLSDEDIEKLIRGTAS